jgi:hypothetical protein
MVGLLLVSLERLPANAGPPGRLPMPLRGRARSIGAEPRAVRRREEGKRPPAPREEFPGIGRRCPGIRRSHAGGWSSWRTRS